MSQVYHADVACDQVVVLQEAFRTCDHDLLVAVCMSDYARESLALESSSESVWRTVEERIRDTLAAMCALEAKSAPSRSFVLLPEETFSLDARTHTVKHRISASLVDLQAAASARVVRRILGETAATFHQIEQVSGASGARAALDDKSLEPRSFMLMPWEEVLGEGAWIPSSLCRRERYMMLASAFWEMAFFELERDCAQVCARAGLRVCESCRHAWREVENEYCERLAREVVVLNHNARVRYFDLYLSVAHQLGVA